MNRLSRRIAIVALASAVGVAVFAFSLFRGEPPQAESGRLSGKVGVVPAAYYLPMFVAKEQGFFAEEGLDVDIIVFNSNADLFTAFLKGEVDSTALGSAGAFPFEATNPGRIRFIYGQNNKSYSFVVPKNSEINSIADLKGKRIGTWPSPTSKTFIQLVLGLQGFESTEYEIVPLEFKSLNRALQTGAVDALFNTDLFSQAGIEAGISRYLVQEPLPELLLNPTFNGGGLLRTETLEADPKKAAKYIRAYRKAIEFIRNNEMQARLLLPKYLPFEENVAKLAPIDEFIQVEEIDLPQAQALAEMFLSAGLLKAPIRVESMIDRNSQ